MADELFALSLWQRLTAVPLAYLLAWLALVGLSITIVVLMRARWGHSRPLQKCAVLSLLVHLVFACLAMTVRIVVGDGGGGAGIGPPIRVRIVEDTGPVATAPILSEVESEIEPEIIAPALLDSPPPPEAPAPDTTAASDATPAGEPDPAEVKSVDGSVANQEPPELAADVPVLVDDSPEAAALAKNEETPNLPEKASVGQSQAPPIAALAPA